MQIFPPVAEATASQTFTLQGDIENFSRMAEGVDWLKDNPQILLEDGTVQQISPTAIEAFEQAVPSRFNYDEEAQSGQLEITQDERVIAGAALVRYAQVTAEQLEDRRGINGGDLVPTQSQLLVAYKAACWAVQSILPTAAIPSLR